MKPFRVVLAGLVWVALAPGAGAKTMFLHTPTKAKETARKLLNSGARFSEDHSASIVGNNEVRVLRSLNEGQVEGVEGVKGLEEHLRRVEDDFFVSAKKIFLKNGDVWRFSHDQGQAKIEKLVDGRLEHSQTILGDDGERWVTAGAIGVSGGDVEVPESNRTWEVERKGNSYKLRVTDMTDWQSVEGPSLVNLKSYLDAKDATKGDLGDIFATLGVHFFQ